MASRNWSKINYRSFSDLNELVAEAATQLPDFDQIVGVPRSGMIPAAILATARNLPLADLNTFIFQNLDSSGRRLHRSSKRSPLVRQRALVVDDSVNTGSEMKKTRQILKHLSSKWEFKFLTVFARSGLSSRQNVDYWLDEVPLPRVFEWNYRNHRLAEYSAYDLDGVLCEDPKESDNDDGTQYEKFIAVARPLFIPRKRISSIITSRLEKYRGPTEEWLERVGVKYGELIMLDGVTAEERRRLRLHATFKAKTYGERKEQVFVESSIVQARKIFELTGKKVISIEGNIFLGDFIRREESAKDNAR